ncbi:MAG: enoyl-CoA hydratase/isomerase family protein, partial [Alphaproteobacteria bacterium]|nr:enoyl-CoA hydratase/isomerase family protein [Alphaproteobacteria bacterium]
MSELTVDRRGDIAVLTINLPDNYMTAATVAELNAATAELDADEGCRAMVFTGGREGVFIRHYSVKVLEEMADQLRAKEQSFSEAKPLLHDRDIDHLFRRLATTPKITIAAINGFAIAGGWSTAQNCTFRIAAEHAEMNIAEARWNQGAGFVGWLPRLIGIPHALEVCLMADRRLSAQRAYE